MKITSMNIENFKAIDSLHFNPRMLNIFVGSNNSGKSTILQAIKLAFDEEYFSFLFFTDPSAALKYGENRAKLELKLIEDKRKIVELEIESVTLNELIPQLENAVIRIFERTLKRVEITNRKTPKKEERKHRVGEIEKELKEWINTETILEMVDKDQLTESTKESVNLIVNGHKKFLSGSTIDIIAQKLAFQIAEKLNISDFLGWREYITTRFMDFNAFDDHFLFAYQIIDFEKIHIEIQSGSLLEKIAAEFKETFQGVYLLLLHSLSLLKCVAYIHCMICNPLQYPGVEHVEHLIILLSSISQSLLHHVEMVPVNFIIPGDDVFQQ